VSRGWPTIAAEVGAAGVDPNNWYSNPEYLLTAALESPCSTTGKVFTKPEGLRVPDGAIDPTTRYPSDRPPAGDFGGGGSF
jgi:hypothetical protein